MNRLLLEPVPGLETDRVISAPPGALPYLHGLNLRVGRTLRVSRGPACQMILPLMIWSCLSASVPATYDMSRYQVIMERSPFGKEPPVEESSAPAKSAGEFAKQYRLCMLYQDAEGQLKAGLVSKTNNKNTFLRVGESKNGLSLVEVRLEEGVAILQQGGETALLMLEGLGTPLTAPTTTAPSAVAAVQAQPSQLIRRSGTDETPAHILAALTDSAPKRPRLTVNKRRSFASTGGSPAGASQTGSPDGFASASFASPDKQPVTVAQVALSEKPANYLIQRVPPRFNPFLTKR